MKIQKSLKITITQADVEQAIIALIANEDPTIVVDDIQFTPKRGGKDSISVKVDAHLGDAVEEQEDEDEEVADEAEEVPEVPVAEDVVEEDELPFESPELKDVEEPAPAPSPKQSLFG